MAYTPALSQLIDALRILPGVGSKTAQRMAFYLLKDDSGGDLRLAEAIQQAAKKIKHCKNCRMYSESELCATCASSRRNPALICIVESPADVLAIEQNTDYQGLYFVLMGHLSPLDGIGPEQLGLDLLRSRLQQGQAKEVILATSATVEGEATARYISELAQNCGAKISRIAHGVPVGGELEYVDAGTLSQAFSGRQLFE